MRSIKQTIDGTDIQVSYGFDTNDLLSTITSPSGTVYTYDYGSLYQIENVKVGGNDIISNSYDSSTHYLSTSTFGNGNTVSYSYDSFGRVKTETYTDDQGSDQICYDYNTEGDLGLVRYGTRKTRYYYDFQGELRGIDTSDGTDSTSVRWTYDDKDNLTGETEKLNGTEFVTEYVYDKDNRVTSAKQGQVRTGYTYNEFNSIKKIETKKIGPNDSESTVIETDIGFYEPSSTRITYKPAAWENQYGNTTKQYSYSYDAKGNITSVSDGTNTTTYVYDLKDQLVREDNQAAGKTWTYTYDNGGNMTDKDEYSYTTAASVSGTPLVSKTYSHDNASWKDQLTGISTSGSGSVSLVYDGAGNVLSDGEWSYTWKHGRQLSEMDKTGQSIKFSYDADGLRRSKMVNDTETKYFYIEGRLTDMKKGSDALHFIYDAIGPSAVDYNGTIYYYLRNAQGDITDIVDSNGSEVVNYSYDAWGKQITKTGSMAATLGSINPFRYRGYVFDEETGLYYLKSRYYNPEWGRFINADIFTCTGQGLLGCNMFSYCVNNPVMYYDPAGMRYCSETTVSGESAYDRFISCNFQREVVMEEKGLVVDLTEPLNVFMEDNLRVLKEFEAENGYLQACKYFYNMVKNGGEYDIKLKPEWNFDSNKTYLYYGKVLRYDDPGNINFGYLGAELFCRPVLCFGAGGNQLRKNNVPHGDIFSFFDDPRDNYMIKYGYALYYGWYI